jgi:glycosyltransferase involved in cell wall biosynthesis
VAIEALACGTPVLARRVGGLDEIIRDGIDGFFGDDVTQLAFLVDRVDELDRAAIRSSVIDRFSAARMADGYEAVYARMLGLNVERGPAADDSGARAGAEPDPVRERESVEAAIRR